MILVTYNIDGKISEVRNDDGSDEDVVFINYSGRVERVTPSFYEDELEDLVNFIKEGCHYCNDGRINPNNMVCHECDQENKL